MADHIRIREHGLDGMIRYFSEEVPAQIEITKDELRVIVTAYSERVASQTPVGPPHKKKGSPIKEGNLRRSVSLEEQDHGDTIEWHGSIGGATAGDYVRYIAARDGVDLLQGFGEMAHAGHEVMAGHQANMTMPEPDYREYER